MLILVVHLHMKYSSILNINILQIDDIFLQQSSETKKEYEQLLKGKTFREAVWVNWWGISVNWTNNDACNSRLFTLTTDKFIVKFSKYSLIFACILISLTLWLNISTFYIIYFLKRKQNFLLHFDYL